MDKWRRAWCWAVVVAMAQDPRVSEFIKLLTSHEVRLRAFALSLIPHWADADEVLQQANLVMWQKFDSFQLGSNFYSWAARIVHLTAKDFRKRQRRDVAQFGDEFFDVVARKTIAASSNWPSGNAC